MKTSHIQIVFNLITILSIGFIFFIPLPLTGISMLLFFWQQNWYIPAIAFVLLFGGNIYFILNKPLLKLLDEGKYPETIGYLEKELYEKNRFSKMRIKLLIATALQTSGIQIIEKLESQVRKKSPRLFRRFALDLGVSHILNRSGLECERYYGKIKDISGVYLPEWVHFCYALGLLWQEKHSESNAEFKTLVSGKSLHVVLLSFSLLSSENDDSMKSYIENKEKEIARLLPSRSRWESLLQKEGKKSIVVAIMVRRLRSIYEELKNEESN